MVEFSKQPTVVLLGIPPARPTSFQPTRWSLYTFCITRLCTGAFGYHSNAFEIRSANQFIKRYPRKKALMHSPAVMRIENQCQRPPAFFGRPDVKKCNFCTLEAHKDLV